jgi:hypothetical protein
MEPSAFPPVESGRVRSGSPGERETTNARATPIRFHPSSFRTATPRGASASTRRNFSEAICASDSLLPGVCASGTQPDRNIGANDSAGPFHLAGLVNRYFEERIAVPVLRRLRRASAARRSRPETCTPGRFSPACRRFECVIRHSSDGSAIWPNTAWYFGCPK